MSSTQDQMLNPNVPISFFRQLTRQITLRKVETCCVQCSSASPGPDELTASGLLILLIESSRLHSLYVYQSLSIPVMRLALVREILFSLPFIPVTLLLVLLYSLLSSLRLIFGPHRFSRFSDDVWSSAICRASAFSRHVTLYASQFRLPVIRTLINIVR